MKPGRSLGLRLVLGLGLGSWLGVDRARPSDRDEAWPGQTWETESPAAAGLSAEALKAAAAYAGGRGCVVRHGRMVFAWGDPTKRGDIASACKPFFSFFLFKAVETGRVFGVDALATQYEPRLSGLNANLGYKDREITLRDLANQISCYGVTERPGTAFDYNDFQMALFWDILFTKIYGATYATVDQQVVHPLLTDPLQCEDNPTLMVFGVNNRPGRVGISPRDHARFGLLYLRGGRWRDGRLLSAEHVRMAVGSHLPSDFPRTKAHAAEMIPGQRTLGSTIVPDDEDDPKGSYSYCWWTNGIDRRGYRAWPEAPTDAYGALGHRNAQRGMAVLPAQDIVVAWNDTDFGKLPDDPAPVGLFLHFIAQAVQQPAPPTP
jgi:CubicO group peptidase (beta-lactamase class C family)